MTFTEGQAEPMTILLFMLHLVIYIITFLHLLPPVCTSSTCLFKLSGHGRNRWLLSIIKTFRANVLKEFLKSSSHYTIIPLQHTCLPGLSTKTNPSINNIYYRAICSYFQIIQRQRGDGHVHENEIIGCNHNMAFHLLN